MDKPVQLLSLNFIFFLVLFWLFFENLEKVEIFIRQQILNSLLNKLSFNWIMLLLNWFIYANIELDLLQLFN